MPPNPVSILFALSLAAIAPLLPAQQGTQQRIEPPHTEQMNFAPGGTIRIDESRGDVYVEGWDQPEVELTVVKSMPYEYKRKHPEEATKHLDSVRVVTERKSATELTISTKHARRRNTDAVILEYEIHVPRDSKLIIQHAKGSVLTIGLTSDINVECSRGDIQLMLRDSGSYSIDAATKFGIVISDFEGTTELRRYRLGERYATPSTHSSPHIFLRMGFGGITIKAVPIEAYSTFSGTRADTESLSAGSRNR
ncbi:MAG TPA: hypothetical protein VK752_33015 [Bryobacteraceae bacterium]|jgi:hypothetical protein|nr:hypothetical protein [Bryobacteraceae bacterium]